MYYFDTEYDGKAIPVAIEKKDKNEVVYLHKIKHKNIGTNKRHYNFNFSEYEKIIKQMGFKRSKKNEALKYLEEYYFDNIEPDDEYKQLYDIVKEKEDKKQTFIANSKLGVLLRPNWYECIYINGPSGSGKSKIIVQIVNDYLEYLKNMKIKPKPEIYLISKKQSDKMIDQIKGIKRIDENTIVDEPITLDEIPDKSIWIFDDWEQFKNDKILYRCVVSFLNDLITMGRTKLIKVFIITHSASMGSLSSLFFQEMTHLISYPRTCSYHSLKLLLQDKVGLDIEEIKIIKNMTSKYVVIHKGSPCRFVISGDKIELI